MKLGVFNQDLLDYIGQQLINELKQGELELIKFSEVNFEEKKDLDVQGLLLHRVTKEQLEQLTELRHMFIPYTGLNRFDLDYIESRGIQIHNAHAHAKFIAERGLAMTMTLTGRLLKHHLSMQDGYWHRSGEDGLWTSLYDKNIGIYGYGHIGQCYEKLIRPFTDKIHIIDRGKYDETELTAMNLTAHRNLKELAAASDLLFIAAPLNESTKGSVDLSIIKEMAGGFIINVARGAIVDQEALQQQLESGDLGGYGSDVWYNYPKDYSEPTYPADVDLKDFENVVMSPHNAWNTDSKGTLIKDEVVENIRKVLD